MGQMIKMYELQSISYLTMYNTHFTVRNILTNARLDST